MTTEREIVDILYRNSFAPFCCQAFRALNPGKTIVSNWHIQAVCHAIEEMVKGEARNRLVLNQPPRSLKSFIASVCLPAWLLGRDPTIRILCASYSQNLANKFSRDCRSLMQSAFYKRVFLRTELNPQKISEGEFETTQHGFRLATSVGGTLTGRGGGILIIDDPINAEDGVASRVALEGANDWFHDTAVSRLDSDDALIMVVQQRLHQNDLSGILIEKGWPRLAIPAKATETESYLIGKDEFYERKAGEALQPKRQTKEELEEKQREVGSRVWAAQYQQNPTPPEGNLIQRAWLVPFDFSPTNRFEQIILACDPAAKSGAQNDYTAIVICGVRHKTVHVLHATRGHWTVMDMVERINQLMQDWKVDLSIVEDTSSGTSVIQILQERHLNVIGRQPKADKETRLLRHQGWFEAGKIRLPKDAPWLADFEDEILGFPGARYDDQVDALLLFLDWYAKRARYESLVEVSVAGLPYVGSDSIRNSDSDRDIATTICGVYVGSDRIRNSDSDHDVPTMIIGVY
jgi:predicted phage terminase large subunit-like protein